MAKRGPSGNDPQRILDDAALAAALDAELLAEHPSKFEPGKRRRISRIGYGQQGVVRKRGSQWRVQYRGEPDKDGRRRQHSVALGSIDDMTLEQARASATRVLDSLAPRRIVPGTTCRWEDWVDRFVALYLPMLRRTSQDSAGSIIRVHLRPAFAGRLLHDITPGRVQALIAKWKLQGVAASTIRARYSVLCRLLGQAAFLGLSAHVPDAKQVRLPRSDAVELRRRNKAFSTDELDKILAAAEEPWLTLFKFMGFAGLRIGEALGLRWCDLDLHAGRMRIVRQAVAGRETAPKTDSSMADRAIPPALLEHLRGFRAQHGGPAEGFLFPSPVKAGPRHASGVRKRHLAPLLKRLGVTGRSSHAFRHWLGITAAREGTPIPALQQVLRHRDRRSTEIYTTLSTADADAALARATSRYVRDARKVLSTPAKRNDGETDDSA